MRYAVGQIICDKIEELNLHYPILDKEAKGKIEEAKKAFSTQIGKDNIEKEDD